MWGLRVGCLAAAAVLCCAAAFKAEAQIREPEAPRLPSKSTAKSPAATAKKQPAPAVAPVPATGPAVAKPAAPARPATAAPAAATAAKETQPAAPAPGGLPPAAAPAPAPTAPAAAAAGHVLPGAPAAAKPDPAATTAALPAGSSFSLPPPANPANCKNVGTFEGWLAEFKKEAAAEGITRETIQSALGGMTLDQGIINRDRGGQKVFTQTFLDFSSKLANPGRIKSSIYKRAKHKALFERAEAEFGVPGSVLTAFWALESDFGAGMGNLPILRSLATLAYDCRRGAMFREELMAALKLIDRGDMTPAEMVGSWAGEIGQTQFLPGHVVRYAIDYDGDGRRDLFRNDADIIGTSANFVKDLGWRAGEPWLMEVRVGDKVPWHEADLTIKHSPEKWTSWGVTALEGGALASSLPPASLVLPMGRHGPAFLAFPNFDVYTRWNQSLVYAITAAYLATRVEGAPPMSRGNAPVASLDGGQIKELQGLLNRRGYQVGEPDGKLGAGTRKAVKAAQIKFGMPADSYPTAELLDALRSGS